MRRIWSVLAAFAVSVVGLEAHAAPLLMISIDGLRPLDVIEAPARHASAPTLRAMMRDGAYATGVIGVTPTSTYPSHMTLLTGVPPARHGIAGNLTFDPLGKNQEGWYWYYDAVTAPSLWSVARPAGLKTLNVGWPVSVGAPVTINIPQIWRSGQADDAKLLHALATPGVLEPLERDLGPYPATSDDELAADETRARFAEALYRREKPDFATVYFGALDHAEHGHAPGSAEAYAALARIDAAVGRLIAVARAARPDVTVVVVSDHGFRATTTDVNLYRPLADAGLLTLDAKSGVSAWEAVPWLMGGSAAIVLKRPDDAVLVARVKRVLDVLAGDPVHSGVVRVLGRAELCALGAVPTATFMVVLRPDAKTNWYPAAPLLAPAEDKGMHGYLPTDPAMHASLFVTGPGLRSHGDLGVVSMLGIAPAVARVLDVELASSSRPTFEAEPLNARPAGPRPLAIPQTASRQKKCAPGRSGILVPIKVDHTYIPQRRSYLARPRKRSET